MRLRREYVITIVVTRCRDRHGPVPGQLVFSAERFLQLVQERLAAFILAAGRGSFKLSEQFFLLFVQFSWYLHAHTHNQVAFAA